MDIIQIFFINLKWSVLEERSYNITPKLSSLIKTFEDFKLVQQIREEMKFLNYLNRRPVTSFAKN